MVVLSNSFAAMHAMVVGLDVDAFDPRRRLAELLRRPAWHTRAACRGEGVGPYFATSPIGEVSACSRCSVRLDCLEFALSDPQTVGWWAGTDLAQRIEARARGWDAAQLLDALDAGEPITDPARRHLFAVWETEASQEDGRRSLYVMPTRAGAGAAGSDRRPSRAAAAESSSLERGYLVRWVPPDRVEHALDLEAPEAFKVVDVEPEHLAAQLLVTRTVEKLLRFGAQGRDVLVVMEPVLLLVASSCPRTHIVPGGPAHRQNELHEPVGHVRVEKMPPPLALVRIIGKHEREDRASMRSAVVHKVRDRLRTSRTGVASRSRPSFRGLGQSSSSASSLTAVTAPLSSSSSAE